MLTGGLSMARPGLTSESSGGRAGPCAGPQGQPEPLEHQGLAEDAFLGFHHGEAPLMF